VLSRTLVIPMVLLAVCAASCGDNPTAPSAPPPTANGPSISVSGSLDFGTVQVERTALRTLTISNTGGSLLTWRIESLGDAAGALTPAANTGTVPPASNGTTFTSTITFSFRPAVAATYSGLIIISSNDGSGDTKVSHSYSGVGSISAPLAGFLSTASSLDFGNVPAGSVVSKAVTFTNTGTAPITVNRVQTDNMGECSVSWPYPYNVQPNANATITVNCAFARRSYSGQLIITSDASNAQVTIPVSASGV